MPDQYAYGGLLHRTAIENIALNADGTLRRKPVVTWEQSIANLAASTTAMLTIDLGEEWHQYTMLIATKSGVASANESLGIQFSIDGTDYYFATAFSTNSSAAWVGTSNWHMCVQGCVHARYARVRFVNGLTQQPSTAMLFLTAVQR